MGATDDPEPVRGALGAEVVLPCAELEPTVRFFTETLGLRLESIAPADAPRTARVAGLGLRLRLEVGADGPPGALRVAVGGPAPERVLVAPNGTRVELVAADAPAAVPEPRAERVVVTRASETEWGAGRAGMQYRDLVPGRLGGALVASHVRIPHGGPVPDYVHHHRVRFQFLLCRSGWVRVVYEDQGPPFVLRAGDGVLQPPEIRHRVLECSDGLEVIEVSVPAAHETVVDHDLELPNDAVDAAREFGGQRFVRHAARGATWEPWWDPRFEARDAGVAGATGGYAEVRVVRPLAGAPPEPSRRACGPCLLVVLAGSARAIAEPDGHAVAVGDAVFLPEATSHAVEAPSADFELLEVHFPSGV